MTRKFFTHLYNSRFVENRIPGRLISLHVPQDTPHTDVLRVDQTEGSDIDEIVLEVLEIERLDILEHRDGSRFRDAWIRVPSTSPGPSVLTKVVKR